MRTRTTIAGALAVGLLLSACGGASDVGPAVEIDEPAEDEPVEDEPVGDEPAGDEAVDADETDADETDADEADADEAPADEDPDAAADGLSGASTPEPDAASFDEPCADHEGREADAFIAVVAPVDEQVGGGSVELVGCSNVNEGTVAWTLLDGDGRTLDEGFTTAECGTGCVGEFRDTVSLGTASDEPVAYLQVFSPNASDEGPRQLQLTEVIVTIG